MPKLMVICAWCEKELGEKECKCEGDALDICDDCLLHHFPHQYQRVKAIEAAEKAKGR